MEEHLQQHISEFVTQLFEVAAADRIEQLVGFLQEVAPQRVVGLFALPRPGGAQLVHDRHRVDQPLAGVRGGRGDQPLTGGQPGSHFGMLPIGREQHRRIRTGEHRPSRRQRPRHLDRQFLGVLHVAAEQFNRLDGHE